MIKNIFKDLPEVSSGNEVFEMLQESSTFLIERIVSNNCISPAEGWFSQNHDEWVMVIQGSATVETIEKSNELHVGDSLFIPAFVKHRVTYTSSSPLCIWLVIHEKVTCINSGNNK